MTKQAIPWPHAPAHRLNENGTFFVTGATYQKQHHFRGSKRLAVLNRGLLKQAEKYSWRLEAWAVFSNHYHFVGNSPAAEGGSASLALMIQELHSKLGAWVNRVDREPKRKVWHNYWETRLTFHRGYLARLNYVHQNAVKHGLVLVANQYPWCSASWFEREATVAQVKTVYRFDAERVSVDDRYEVASDW
jgi:putative transposase